MLQPFVERHALAGAVALVVSKTNILATEAAGYSDIRAGKVMRKDAMFWIASQSKPMTTTAFMMLVDESKLALDDPVEKYLPEFKGQMLIAEKDATHVVLRKPARRVTLRDLLSHMSGMPFKSQVEEPTLDGLPLAAAVRSYAMTPLEAEPGTHYQYSNAGINTAARVIEVVSRMPYEEFMRKRLFEPLRMKDTTFWPNEKQTRRIAKSYKPNSAKNGLEETTITQLQFPLSDHIHRFAMPAGGLFSTAQDTARFCQMLLNGGQLDGHRYISEAALAELKKRQTPGSVKESYGLGFSVDGENFGHGGAYATNMEIRPTDGIAIIWMVQHAGFPLEGDRAQSAFRAWARETFAKSRQ
ncbi:MAG TPA: serine hydrolase domain-containing protein [Verrucomicrobiae bacterium]